MSKEHPRVFLIKKETLAQIFSCEFCEISKNTCFTESLWTAASDSGQVVLAAVSGSDQ